MDNPQHNHRKNPVNFTLTPDLTSYIPSNDDYTTHSHCLLDSGYNSGTFTPNSTPHRLTGSFIHTKLDRIDEIDPGSTILTPTTKNINKLDSLHLTAPSTSASIITATVVSPLKRAANTVIINGTPKKQRQNNENKLYQQTPKKDLKRIPSFKEKFNQNKIEFSPIPTKVLQEKSMNGKVGLQRTNSTSTPIHNAAEECERKTQSVSPKKRLRLMRKVASFSPRLAQRNFDSSLTFEDQSKVKKRLDWTIESTTPTPTILVKQAEPIRKQFKRQNAVSTQSPVPQPETGVKSRLCKTRNSLDLVTKVPRKYNISNTDLMSPEIVRKESKYVGDTSLDLLPPNNDNLKKLLTGEILIGRSLSPSPPPLPSSSSSVSSLQNFSLITPSKIEWNVILHSDLPKTPTKSTSIITNNNNSNTKQPQTPRSINGYPASTPKKKRTSKYSRQMTYEGIKRLNILGHLDSGTVENIVEYLDGPDIIRLGMVCKTYDQMLKGIPMAMKKKASFLKTYLPSKENTITLRKSKELPDRREGVGSGGEDEETEVDEVTHKTIPLCKRNSNNSIEINRKRRSPPVSPSRRLFDANQKVRILF